MSYRRIGDVMETDDVEQKAVMVPCRMCGRAVEMGPTGVWFARKVSALLEARGEEPLRSGEVMFCPPCGKQREEAWVAKRNAEDEACRTVMRASLAQGSLSKSDEEFLCKHGWDWVRDGGFEKRLEAYRAKSAGKAPRKNVDRGAGFGAGSFFDKSKALRP